MKDKILFYLVAYKKEKEKHLKGCVRALNNLYDIIEQLDHVDDSLNQLYYKATAKKERLKKELEELRKLIKELERN